MAGFYIHIPFCHQKCSYCDFYFSTLLKHKEKVVDAIVQEITRRKDEITQPLETIYFGGGTPSILSIQDTTRIIDTIYRYYPCHKVKEVTLEANPEDLSPAFLQHLQSTGINRLSIGTQSFVDDELQLMNRKHTAAEAISAIQRAQDAGFDNITIDLIYAVTPLYQENLHKNLTILEQLNVPHFSAYALTIEQHTLLHHQVKKHRYNILPDTAYEYCFEQIHQFARTNGYAHYEISNFARKNYRSLHNSNYWNGKPYIGIGPSAHSFDGNSTRRWNIANNHLYARKVTNGDIYFEQEILSEENKWNEYLMTQLRTEKGIDLVFAKDKFPGKYVTGLLQKLEQLPHEWYNRNRTSVSLTVKGWLVSDFILKKLMV